MASIVKGVFGKKPDPPPAASTIPPPSYATRPPKGHATLDSDDDEPAQTSLPLPSSDQPNRPGRPDRNIRSSLNGFDGERNPRAPSNNSRSRPGRDEDEHDGDFHDRNTAHYNLALTRIERPHRETRPSYPNPRRGARGRSPDYDDYDDDDDDDDEPQFSRGGPIIRRTRHRGADPSRALVHAMANNAAATGSAAMTIIRSGGDDHNDVLAMPKYGVVSFSSLSLQNLEAIKDVFKVPTEKIETWCKLGRVEKHNGTGELRMDKVCALFDRHYAARWEERMEEDRVGITRAKKEKAENAKVKEEKERKRDREMRKREGKRDKVVEEREAKRDKEMKEKAKKAKVKAEAEVAAKAKATPASGNGAVVMSPAVVVPGYYGGYHHPYYHYPYGPGRWYW